MHGDKIHSMPRVVHDLVGAHGCLSKMPNGIHSARVLDGVHPWMRLIETDVAMDLVLLYVCSVEVMHEMTIKILLTGPPGCGKTTAIRQVLDHLHCEAHGFTTQEIREGGRRTGFKLTTLDGREGLLAHTRIPGRPRVGKYGVDLKVMDELAVEAIRRGMLERSLIVIDEIGPMELLSSRFRSVVLEALETDLPMIGTIMMRSSPFADAIKARPNVHLIQVSRGTMGSTVEGIVETLVEQGHSRRF